MNIILLYHFEEKVMKARDHGTISHRRDETKKRRVVCGAILNAKVSDLYGSFAACVFPFFSPLVFFRVTFAGRKKSAVRARKGPAIEQVHRSAVLPSEKKRRDRRTITGCTACVWNGSIYLAKLRAACSVSVSINAITRSLV